MGRVLSLELINRDQRREYTSSFKLTNYIGAVAHNYKKKSHAFNYFKILSEVMACTICQQNYQVLPFIFNMILVSYYVVTKLYLIILYI